MATAFWTSQVSLPISMQLNSRSVLAMVPLVPSSNVPQDNFQRPSNPGRSHPATSTMTASSTLLPPTPTTRSTSRFPLTNNGIWRNIPQFPAVIRASTCSPTCRRQPSRSTSSPAIADSRHQQLGRNDYGNSEPGNQRRNPDRLCHL